MIKKSGERSKAFAQVPKDLRLNGREVELAKALLEVGLTAVGVVSLFSDRWAKLRHRHDGRSR